MGTASDDAKQRWNRDNYTQVKVSVKPEIAAAFKLKCLADGVSMASRISRFMDEININPSKDSIKTRGQRRKAVKNILTQLDNILNAETEYLDNIPQNLQNSRNYEAAEQTVAMLEEVINSLNEAY